MYLDCRIVEHKHVFETLTDSISECAAIQMDHSVLSTPDRAVKIQVLLTCESGYALQDGQDSMTLTCQTDRNWSSDYTQNPCLSE